MTAAILAMTMAVPRAKTMSQAPGHGKGTINGQNHGRGHGLNHGRGHDPHHFPGNAMTKQSCRARLDRLACGWAGFCKVRGRRPRSETMTWQGCRARADKAAVHDKTRLPCTSMVCLKRPWPKARIREHDRTRLPCKTRQGCRARLDKAAVYDYARLPCMTIQGFRV